jgi:hypothetical protein
MLSKFGVRKDYFGSPIQQCFGLLCWPQSKFNGQICVQPKEGNKNKNIGIGWPQNGGSGG